MARARLIKPELLKDPDLRTAERAAGLPMFTLRVALQQLALHCDGNGAFPWKPTHLHDLLLPGDDIDFSRVLHVLEQGEWVRRYVDEDGAQFGVIRTFLQHHPEAEDEAAGTFCPPPPAELLSPKAQRRFQQMEPVRKTRRGKTTRADHRSRIGDRSPIDPDPDHPGSPQDPRGPDLPPQPLRAPSAPQAGLPSPAPRIDDDDDARKGSKITRAELAALYQEFHGHRPTPGHLRTLEKWLDFSRDQVFRALELTVQYRAKSDKYTSRVLESLSQPPSAAPPPQRPNGRPPAGRDRAAPAKSIGTRSAAREAQERRLIEQVTAGAPPCDCGARIDCPRCGGWGLLLTPEQQDQVLEITCGNWEGTAS